MTDAQKKMAEALGLTEKDFAPTPRPEQRLVAVVPALEGDSDGHRAVLEGPAS